MASTVQLSLSANDIDEIKLRLDALFYGIQGVIATYDDDDTMASLLYMHQNLSESVEKLFKAYHAQTAEMF